MDKRQAAGRRGFRTEQAPALTAEEIGARKPLAGFPQERRRERTLCRDNQSSSPCWTLLTPDPVGPALGKQDSGPGPSSHCAVAPGKQMELVPPPRPPLTSLPPVRSLPGGAHLAKGKQEFRFPHCLCPAAKTLLRALPSCARGGHCAARGRVSLAALQRQGKHRDSSLLTSCSMCWW